jgi:hypothetical protein
MAPARTSGHREGSESPVITQKLGAITLTQLANDRESNAFASA